MHARASIVGAGATGSGGYRRQLLDPGAMSQRAVMMVAMFVVLALLPGAAAEQLHAARYVEVGWKYFLAESGRTMASFFKKKRFWLQTKL